MRRRRRVWYDIVNNDKYYWQKGKLTKTPQKGISWSLSASMPTFQKAKRCAWKCPAETYILKYFIKHGRRYVREYILSAAQPKLPMNDTPEPVEQRLGFEEAL